MAGANGFYSPPTPLKVCQGPAHTAQCCSVRRQALTWLPPPSLPVPQRLRLLPLYGGICDVLQELFDDWGNDGGRRESSQHFSATHTQKKKPNKSRLGTSPAGRFPVPVLPVNAAQPSSRQSELDHVRRFVAGGGCARQHVSPAEQPFHAPA